MRTAMRSVMLTMLVLPLVVGTATAQQGEWVRLGQRAVTDRADHDKIVVTGARGDFKQIKFEVERGSVDFRRVVVHFASGDDQKLELRNTVPAGGETRAIDLDGKDRVIQSVEFWYDANTRRGRQATVRLLGKR
ncbi:MAG: DUF2541 family protein [Gemmatimonadales bacterium]|nr:DUF2541 family protein [Gemmatimonadales bacterium]